MNTVWSSRQATLNLCRSILFDQWPIFENHFCAASTIDAALKEAYSASRATMKGRSESGNDVEIAMIDKKRSGLTKASSARGSRKQSMFGGFSFSNSTVSHTEEGAVSKMDAARITAPFIMGQTTQQTMPCVCVNKKGQSTEKSVSFHLFH